MISSNARFTIVAVLLAATALFVHARSDGRFAPPRSSLATFPMELSRWFGADIPIPNDALKKLGPGEFLQRAYQDATAEQPNVDLYIAYFPNQTIVDRHLPEQCLAGSGWSVVESEVTDLTLPGDASFPVNRYLISKGSDRQLILFWYSAQGRRVAREDGMDWYLVLDRGFNRADNALIRMNTELQSGEEPGDAERRLLSFAALANPLFKDYIPAR